MGLNTNDTIHVVLHESINADSFPSYWIYFIIAIFLLLIILLNLKKVKKNAERSIALVQLT